MEFLEIVSIVATFLGVTSFSVVFTILYRSYVASSVAQIEAGKRDIPIIDAALRDRARPRRRRWGSIVKNVLFILFLLIVIPVFVFSLVNRFAGDRPVFGRSVMVVASGSMSYANEENGYLADYGLEDRFDRFDIIVLQAVSSPAELKVYDVIAYRNDEGVNIIHRIVEEEGAGDGIRYTTRGDANNASDEYQPAFSDVIGVYRGTHVRGVGVVIMFIQSWSGIITVVAMLYCLFMIDRVSRRIEACEEKRRDQLMRAIESDETTAKSMRAEFRETIFYRGYAYRFNETGFLGKTALAGDHAEDDVMVKVYDGVPAQRIPIETRKDHAKEASQGKE